MPKSTRSSTKSAPSAKNSRTRLPAQNSEETAKKPRGRPFQKGQSGNPGGRPAVPEHVREACRALTEIAVLTLKQVMTDEDAPASARVSAANAVLDRAWGKPESDVRVGGLPGAPPITNAEFARLTPQQAYEFVCNGGDFPKTEGFEQ